MIFLWKSLSFLSGKTIGKVYVVLFFLFFSMYMIIYGIGFIFWVFEWFGKRTVVNES